MTRRPLSLGFIGGGANSAVGATHFIAARMGGLFSIDAGAFSRNAAVNHETAERWNVPPGRVYDSPQLLLEQESGRLDAVVVLTPTPDHADAIVRALELGHAVICDKALASSVEDARRIAAMVRDQRGFVAVTFNYNGYPMVRELRRLIAEGRLGRISQIQAEMPQEGFLRLGPDGAAPKPQPWRSRDGSIPTISLDLGDDLHHLVRFLTGERPIEVLALQGSHGRVDGVVDSVMALARYSGGIDCAYWFSKAALGCRNGLRLRVFGSDGAAEWRQTEPEELLLSDAQGRRTVLDRGSPEATVAAQARYARFKAGHPAGFIEAFANLYDDIAHALVEHKAGRSWASPMVCDAGEALEGLAALEAMALSSDRRGWVTVAGDGA